MLPEVMEVEVSPEGRWRPANMAYAWQEPQGEPLPAIPKVLLPQGRVHCVTLGLPSM